MAEIVYVMCAVMSAICAAMLLKSYYKFRSSLLLWSGLCFVGLALNNSILVVDVIIFPEVDFHGGFWRSLIAAISGALLLYGLIWELA